MATPDLVECLDHLYGAERLPVDRHRVPFGELDLYVLGGVRRVLWRRRPLKHLRIGLERRILERSALVGDVPEVLVTRIELGLIDPVQRNVALPRISEELLARAVLPFTPGGDDGQLRRERLKGQLEADLIVPLPRAAVGERVRTDLPRDRNHAATDDRPGHRGAQQVLPTVHRPGPKRGPDEILHEALSEILAVEFRGACRLGLLGQSFEAARLTDICGDADDLGTVVLAKPGHDHRGVEASRIP